MLERTLDAVCREPAQARPRLPCARACLTPALPARRHRLVPRCWRPTAATACACPTCPPPWSSWRRQGRSAPRAATCAAWGLSTSRGSTHSGKSARAPWRAGACAVPRGRAVPQRRLGRAPGARGRRCARRCCAHARCRCTRRRSEWVHEEGEFAGIMLVIMPCRSEKSVQGVARCVGLGAGQRGPRRARELSMPPGRGGGVWGSHGSVM